MSCPDCLRGEILQGEPKGVTQPDGSYFRAAPNPETSDKSKAVVLLTDVFGLALPNGKLIADHLAENLNVDVYVPDMFEGYYMMPFGKLKFPDHQGFKRGWWDWISYVFNMIAVLPRIISNRPSVVDRRVKSFVQKLRESKGYDKIGGLGYCYGGSLSLRLAQPGILDAVVSAHPGGPMNIKDVKSPVSFICAEEDFSFGPQKREEFEAALAARKGKGPEGHEVDYEFVVYEKTVHGFGIRPVFAYPENEKAFEGSKVQMVKWFEKTL
ncbi:dienelactone hydrolase endo-1,3,1,4-beta-D-glucanase [Flagelloscypha sp. PMI_526]|nr:dienelactone hydrolase endo-1,3,1,4-beta-D-glucanase [Flagelloscypha sp. PMI_526]